MADQKQDKDYSNAELTKIFRESVKQLPAYVRKHIDVNRIQAVNASGQNPADYASADQKDAVNNKDAIADVRDGSRTVVHIYRPSEFVKDPVQISGHEAVHFVQNGLPDDVKSKLAPVNPQDPYSYGGNAGVAADAKAGKPIESLSPEQQAALAQYSIAFDKFADKGTNANGDGVPTAAQQDWENNRDNYQHYTDQIAKWPQKPYDDDKEPIIKDDDPRLKIDMNLQPNLPPAGTIPAAQPVPVTNVATGSFQAGMLFGPGDSAPGEAPTNPFDQLTKTPAASAPPPVAASAPASNPFDSLTTTSTPAAASTPAPVSSNPFDSLTTTSKPATPQSPENGQPASDPNAGILKKAWNWANTPLTESLGGLPDSRPGAGGVERGLEKVASGFTSPLSIALTLGTFGTAGFIESAGASVLRDVAGMSAAEIADVAKGADAIAQATKTGGNYAEAIQASGADPAVVKKGLDALYAAGLKEGDLTGGNAAERGASLMFRKFALSPAKAQVAAKTMQTAVDAGFTYQAVQQAAQMSPRALDALKEGDYDHFAEYATEALAGAAFGAAGASHAIHSAGELAEPLLENKLRPSDETRKFSNLFDARDGEEAAVNQKARLLQENTMKALGYVDPKRPFVSGATTAAQDLRLNQMFHGITLGFDKDLAAEHYNAIAEAAGRPDRLSVAGVTPDVVQTTPEFKKWFGDSAAADNNGAPKTLYHGTNAAGFQDFSKDNLSPWSLYGPGVYMTENPEVASDYAGVPDKNASPLAALFSGASQFRGNIPLKDIRDYFTPGSVVKSYGGYDKVLKFNEPDPSKGYPYSNWSVDVIETDKNGNPVPGARVRNHATPPDPKEFIENRGKAVYPLHAAIEKPFDIDAQIPKSEADKIFGKYNQTKWIDDLYSDRDTVSGKSLYNRAALAYDLEGENQHERTVEPERKLPEGDSAKESVNKLLQKAGYDGIKHTGGSVTGGKPHQVWIAFDPKQVRSSLDNFGYTNRGAAKAAATQSLENGQVNENPNGAGPEGNLAGTANGTVQAAPPNPALPSNLRDLIANSDLKNKPADYIDHLLDVYKGVHEGFNDTEMAVAKDLRSKLQTGIADANANGIIKGQVENYMQRRWEKPNPTANKTIADAGMGKFTTNVSMAQKRVFESELEPILKGYQLRAENPITLTSQWLADTYKAIANRKLLTSVLDRNLRASDGRPAVVMLGNGQVLEGSEGGNPATMIRPDSVRNIKIADPEIQNLKATGALDRYLDDQTILDLTPKVHPDTIPSFIDRLERIATSKNAQYDEQGNNVLRQQIQTLKDIQSGKRPMSDLAQINDAQKPVYVWRPQDYIHLDQPSMRKWNFVVHDPSGDPVLVKSDLAVHPEYADYLKTRLGLDESGLQKWGPTRALLKGGGEAKKLMLSFSPFHMMQEALRGVMVGVNPFHLTDRTIAEDPVLQNMVSHRLTLEPDYKGLQDETEGVAGHSKILDKLPFGIGKAMDWYQDFLFKKYIPSLKAEAAVKMFNEYKDAHPDWTDDRVAEVASAHVNDTFGGINYKAMGRSVATQDWARLLTLAPDWLEAELRSGSRLFNGDGGVARNQVAKMALGLWGVARVLNYVTTGNFHNEAPFGLAMKDKDGKEMVYSVRTLPTDLLHAATDPVGFMKGRFSPALRAGQEILSSRDQFGRKLSPGDMAVDLARNFAPIPFQSLGQAISGNGPEIGNTGQAAKAAGFTAQVYRTEAQKLAAQIASDHSESGPIDPALLHRHRVIMNFEDQVRSGQMALPQVYQMVVSGDLSQADAKKIAENVKVTRGMPADMASLYTRSSRLPPKDFLSVWDISTPQEKTALAPLMIKNRKSYVKKAMTDETPQERQRDPVLHRFMAMFPQATPF